MGVTRKLVASLLSLVAAVTAAQPMPGPGAARVTFAPPAIVTVTRGKPGTVTLNFRVGPGYHINSNKPRSELLIPTTLKLDAPTHIRIGMVSYPKAEGMSLPCAPGAKLNA